MADDVYRPDMTLKGKLRRRIVRLQHRRPVRGRTPGARPIAPMISFCFDDVTQTAVSVGAEILEARGLRGSFFVCSGLMNETGHMGAYATSAQIVAAAQAGHEVGCHTYSHLDCGQAKASAIASDLDRNQAAFVALGVAPPTTFAFPFGDVSAQAKRVAGDRFQLCRALHHGLIKPGADLNQAPAVRIEGDDGEDVARRWMAAASAQGAWLILYTHMLAVAASEFGCSTAGFTRLVDDAVAQGFNVVTVAQGARAVASGHPQ